MNEDMSELIQKMNEMLKNNEIPENIKNIVNGISSDNSSNEGTRENNENKFDFPDFDLNTMMKLKTIMDNMKKEQNDPRANLLKSLKPYLRSSRKDKVDQYVQLFRMGKIFEIMNPLGGEKKNDV